MTGRIEGCQQLSELIDEQTAAAGQLLEILTAEKSALTGNEVQVLQDLDARKRAQLSRTEHLEQNRRQLCRTLGIGAERGAMDYLINDLAAAGHHALQGALRTGWQRLKELMVACRDANEVNGLVAQFKQRQLLHLLGLMRGGSPGTLTYQSTGTTAQAGVSSRAIVEV
jgi:flagellar biosynthesis/type III secretory pathway chaperone